ncbi:MAG TPA: fused MFS/spermidine synthase, partial [Nocardioides sp.]|nr:fused MFS/spermidine synthase [Nocardioides sp.]
MSHEPGPDPQQETGPGLGPGAAAALVFGSSAAVLVVELVALRLLAPYYGLTLETNTMVIGLALTAIAAGTWAGGWSADRAAPRHLLGPLLGISGAAVAL